MRDMSCCCNKLRTLSLFVRTGGDALLEQKMTRKPDIRPYKGKWPEIAASAYVDASSVLVGDIVIGDDCRINPHCVLYSGNGIRIGNQVLIAPGVSIVPANHNFARRDVPIVEQGFRASRGGVVIESNVWIGAHAVILDGTHIERGAIIGAGSVVRGRVPAFQIWAGVPAARIKDRP